MIAQGGKPPKKGKLRERSLTGREALPYCDTFNGFNHLSTDRQALANMTTDKRLDNLRQVRARQKRYRAIGLCTCGGTPMPGYKECASCRRTRKARLQRYRAEGQCHCGRPVMSGLKKNGKPYKSCEVCIERERARRS